MDYSVANAIVLLKKLTKIFGTRKVLARKLHVAEWKLAKWANGRAKPDEQEMKEIVALFMDTHQR